MTEVGGCQQRIGLVMASVYCRVISVTDDYSEALTHWALQSSRKKELRPARADTTRLLVEVPLHYRVRLETATDAAGQANSPRDIRSRGVIIRR
jgi:hypothetical protein